MECKIEIKWKDVDGEYERKTFTDAKSLEEYLLNNWDVINARYKQVKNQGAYGLPDLFSAINPQNDTCTKLEKFSAAAKLDANKIAKANAFHPSSASGYMFSSINEKNPIYDNDFKGKIKEYAEKKFGNDLVKAKKYNNDLTDYRLNSGTWIHSYIEREVNPAAVLSHPSFNLGSGVATKATETAKQILEAVKLIVGDNDVKLYSELEIFKPDFTPDFQALINEVIEAHKGDPKYEALKNIKGFTGRIDLIAVDKKGRLHLFDFKTSKHETPTEKSNRSARLQLALYAEVLRSAGFDVAGTYKVPIQLTSKVDANNLEELDDAGKFTLTDINFNKNKIITFNSNDTLNIRIAQLFGYKSTINHDKLSTDFDIFKKMFYQISDTTTAADDEKIIDRQVIEFERNHDRKVFSLHPIEDLKTYRNQRLYDEKVAKGFNYYVQNLDEAFFGERRVVGDIIYFHTIEEARTKIREYVKTRNDRRADFYKTFANNVSDILAGKKGDKLEALDTLARNTNFISKEYLNNLLYKYIKNGWTLDQNDELTVNGYLVFTKNNKVEIVSFVRQDLYNKVPLKHGAQTVLNNMILDTEVGTDDTKVVNTLYGNIMALRAMLLLTNHPDLIRPGCKVQAIRVCNIYLQQTIDESIGKLAESWDRFVFYWNDNKRAYQVASDGEKSTERPELLLTGIGKKNSIFMDPVEAYLQRAYDYLLTKEGLNLKQEIKDFFAGTDYSFDKILKIYQDFKKTYGGEIGSISKLEFRDNPIRLAFVALGNAVLEAAHWMPSVEADVASIMDGALNGVRATSPAVSKSATMRLAQKIVASYEESLRITYEQDLQEWQEQLAKAIDEFSPGSSSTNLGSMFEGWMDPDHPYTLLDPRMNPYFNGKPEQQKLAMMFLRRMSEYRGEIGGTEGYEEYYQVPLLEQGFFEMLQDHVTIKDALKKEWNDIKKLIGDLALNRTKSNWEARQSENIDVDEIPNYFFMQTQESRERMLERGNIYEMDLDRVMLYVTLQNSRKKVSRTYLPYIAGFRATLQLFREINGSVEPQIISAVDDFFRLVVFGKPIAEEHHQNLYKFAQFLKGITSATTLKFNIKNFTRENLADFFRINAAVTGFQDKNGNVPEKSTYTNAFMKGMAELENDPTYRKSQLFLSKIKSGDYNEALGMVIAGCCTDKKLMLKISKLNSLAGMANISQAQLADYNKNIGKLGIDEGYWTTTWPDFFHRNAILIAYMKKEGYWDAYEINDKNELEYHMEKDKRWSILFKYGFSEENYDPMKIQESDRKAYREAALYYKMLLDKWKVTKPDIKYGDKLPQGFTIDDTNSIRTWADKLFGSYDDATKALMQSQVLGSLFFQYKNYTLAMMSGWWSSTTHINADKLVKMTDESGENIWRVVSTDEEYAKTGKVVQYKKESELTPEEINENRAEPVTWWEGDPMKGKIQSMLEMGKAIVNGDWETYKRLQESPIFRYNFALILYDSLIMGIIAGLLRFLLYGKEKVDKMKNQDFATRWTYAVLNGMAQDGSLVQTFKSIVGEGSMPCFSTISTYFSNMLSVITGKRNAAYALLNSFGATRELSAFFNDAREVLE